MLKVWFLTGFGFLMISTVMPWPGHFRYHVSAGKVLNIFVLVLLFSLRSLENNAGSFGKMRRPFRCRANLRQFRPQVFENVFFEFKAIVQHA